MKNIIYLYLIMFGFCILTLNVFSQQNSESNNAFTINPKRLKISFSFFNSRNLRLISFLPEGVFSTDKMPVAAGGPDNEVFLQCIGENQAAHHGTKLTGSNPGEQLLFIGKNEVKTSYGRQVIITQYDSTKKLKVESFYEYNTASPTVRRYTKVINERIERVGIEYLSSAILNNFYNTENATAEKKCTYPLCLQ